MKVLRIYHGGRDSAHRERDRALVRAGVDLTLVVPSEWPGNEEPIRDEQFEVVELAVKRAGDVNRHRYRDIGQVRDVIERVQPDVLAIHEEPFSSVVHQILRVVPSDLPIVTYAAQNIDKRFPPPFAQWERRALSRIDGIYPCTRQAASVVAGKGFLGEIEVLPLPPAPQIRPGNQQPPTGEVRMLLVGRLVPEKGISDAVEVLAALRDRNATLTIVGTGEEQDTALARAYQRGVADRLDLHPWATVDELAAIYAESHVLLTPSRTTQTWVEQFGRMVVEAHAAGVVVVGYASGSLPEVVGDAGVLVPEGDRAALAAAVSALLDDPQRWTELRQAGLARGATTTWDAVAAAQVELYERVIAKPRGRGRVRPRRREAVQRFGEPARIRGGDSRPFALPVLRNDNAATRALGKVLDATSRAEPPPVPARLKVVYLDHVARMSGGELALLRLIQALPDVDAHVILAEDGPLRPALEEVGATVEVLPLDPRTRDLRRDQVGAARLATIRTGAVVGRYTHRLARRIRELQPDLVHANSLKSGYYGTVAARLARVPVIWHLRDRIADDYLPARAGRITHLLLRYLPDLVICNSAETLRTAGSHLRAGAIVGSPVVPDPYEPVARRRASRTSNVIGIVGRLAEWKGQHVFLRALADVRTEHPEIRGRIIGSAMFGEHEYEQQLHRLAAELGLANAVDFVGFVEGVEAELAGLDVLVHASVLPEPFGQVVVEGMAAGLPVVATSAGGPAEIITDGVNGLLVPPGDVSAMSGALRQLLGDKQLRTRLGRAARARAEDFAPEVIGAQVRALYQELVARS